MRIWVCWNDDLPGCSGLQREPRAAGREHASPIWSNGLRDQSKKGASLPMLLMPYTTSGRQDRTIDGHSAPTRDLGLDQLYQMAAQAADLSRQALWDREHLSFQGRRVGKLPCSCNNARSVAISVVGCSPARQFFDLMQVTDNPDHSCLLRSSDLSTLSDAHALVLLQARASADDRPV